MAPCVSPLPSPELTPHLRPDSQVLAYLERSFLALTKVEGIKENGDIVAAADGLQGITSDWPNKKSARRPPTDITPEEVRGALNLYKAKLALMARMSKSSKREIKTTLNACAQNTTGLFLKSNLEYLRQNYRKAIKLLNNSCQRSDRDPNVSALYFNNMGCIHHLMRRHTAACFYFTRALQENDALYSGAAEKETLGHAISLPAFACDRRCEIHYNKGLQLLLSSRPEQAFASFQESLHLLHRQPRAWLRVGEACAAAHIQQMQAAQAARQEGEVSALVSSSVGRGSSRRLVAPVEEPPTEGAEPVAEGEVAAEGTHATASAPAPPAPTLGYGVKCFRNALLLCEASGQLGDYAALALSSAQGTPACAVHSAGPPLVVPRPAPHSLPWPPGANAPGERSRHLATPRTPEKRLSLRRADCCGSTCVHWRHMPAACAKVADSPGLIPRRPINTQARLPRPRRSRSACMRCSDSRCFSSRGARSRRTTTRWRAAL